jgi:hypothetical protein
VKIKIYRTIILPVLYGCETWFLILEKNMDSLMVFQNRVLKRIFEPMREEVTGLFTVLHSEELNNLYYYIILLW